MKKCDYWQESVEYLCKIDEKLASIIESANNLEPSKDKTALESLLGSIVSQQISVKAAASIWQKVTELVGDITTDGIIATGADNLKACGLSGRKADYFINIAQHFRDNNIDEENHWHDRQYSDVYDELIQIKGVGPWTIEMFGMFYLMEQDILPLKDLGIIRAINQLYNESNVELEMTEILNISNKWRPYRTVASLYLWHSVDN